LLKGPALLPLLGDPDTIAQGGWRGISAPEFAGLAGCTVAFVEYVQGEFPYFALRCCSGGAAGIKERLINPG